MIYQKFNNKELEYIYKYCDCDANEHIYKQIERKIRKQIWQAKEYKRCGAGKRQALTMSGYRFPLR